MASYSRLPADLRSPYALLGRNVSGTRSSPARRAVLMVVVGFLGVFGLVLQVAAGWASIPGDAVWAACALTFGLAGFVGAQHRPRTRAALVSMIAQGLFGLSAALVMIYWIVVDAGWIARNDPVYLALPYGLGLIALAALLAPRRGARRP
jgi:hypothetical protein